MNLAFLLLVTMMFAMMLFRTHDNYYYTKNNKLRGVLQHQTFFLRGVDDTLYLCVWVSVHFTSNVLFLNH
jgi:hypothetical protein